MARSGLPRVGAGIRREEQKLTCARFDVLFGRAVCLTAVLVALGAPAATADIQAVVEVPAPNGSNLDLAIVNAATGVRSPLPASVNTTADEFHPSLSADGRRLVFERVDRSAGTTRIIVVDLSTGRQADVFNVFEAQSDQPSTPAITPDGSQVITTGPVSNPITTGPVSNPVPYTRTSLANFPNGPFPKTESSFDQGTGNPAAAIDPVQRSDGLLAFGAFQPGHTDYVVVLAGSFVEFSDAVAGGVDHPALSDPATNVLVAEQTPGNPGAGVEGPAQLISMFPADAIGAGTSLPPIVNAPGLDESHPSFTADGRFLAFIRATGDGHEHLFVFDTQTQTLLNSNGIDLGALYTSPAFGQLARTEGNIALRQVAVFERVSLSQTGTLVARLLASGLVGILVQRIVGHHKLLGRTVSTLVTVGRVPLGQHHAGRFKLIGTSRSTADGSSLAPTWSRSAP